MRLNLEQIAAFSGGSFLLEPSDPDAMVKKVNWDSRTVAEGDLYIALPGTRVDGHDFVSAALKAGALGALVMCPPTTASCECARECGAAIIQVGDTTQALRDIAGAWRTFLKARVIAITGSVGKTTTKNLVKQLLASSYCTVATFANQNNELGVPKTLIEANPSTEALVVEMGMRGAGQISQLCDFVQPDWGMVLNVGESHIELLGSRENIARAKAELFQALPAHKGLAFINAADDFCRFMQNCGHLRERDVNSVLFDGSLQARSHREELCSVMDCERFVWAEQIQLDSQGYPHFQLCTSGFGQGEERICCVLSLRGLHNVSNACAAAAVARAFGMTLSQIGEVLGEAQATSGRQEVLHASRGFMILNDAYNANPDSMCASLNLFKTLGARGRRIAVLGDMAELGSYSQDCHLRVGQQAASTALDRLICIGEQARFIAQAAQRAGMDASGIICYEKVSEIVEDLNDYLQPHDIVLLKASHFIGLERVAEGLVN